MARSPWSRSRAPRLRDTPPNLRHIGTHSEKESLDCGTKGSSREHDEAEVGKNAGMNTRTIAILAFVVAVVVLLLILL